MIQMRENRYDDIRKGTVSRGGESPEAKTTGQPETNKEAEKPSEMPSSPRSDNEEEYNSWS